MLTDLAFTLSSLRAAYAQGVTPEQVVTEAFRRYDAANNPGVLIHDGREVALAAARAMAAPNPDQPLWGIPFVAKDNIDVAGMPTTAACPDFAFQPSEDAFVVAMLKAAGAICLGKANLDQFATGLVGTRSPYRLPLNALDPQIVPGGSSSGSGVSVAAGMCSFALGTDTAGSGRVPAALNGIVGLKPSLGALSSTGMVPACRTLDTISVFAMTVEDAWQVFSVAAKPDTADAYSRVFSLPKTLPAAPKAMVMAVPDQAALEAGTDAATRADFAKTCARMEAAGARAVALDMAPFFEVARLLYEGPWVAERTAALGARITDHPETLHPVTRQIVSGGLRFSAVDLFNAQYRLRALTQKCRAALKGVDIIMVPSIPGFVTVAQDKAEPIAHNARLGTWTNFVNLLDMCAIAVPTGLRDDGRPGSVTLLAPAGADARVAAVAATLEAGPLGATSWPRPKAQPAAPRALSDEIEIAVCGAHMAGLLLNPELSGRGGRFLEATQSAPEYRFYALAGGPPARPGMVRVGPQEGAALALEIWALPRAAFGDFIAGVPAPLGIGTVKLADGRSVKGFICENAGLEGATDITATGGWRAFLAQQA